MNRDFKGIWIPREIWLDKSLTLLERALWAEIHSLFDREMGGCYASNEYLAEFAGVQERRLQQMLANLKARGWLVQVSFDGRKRVIKAVVPPEDFRVDAGQRCNEMHPRDAINCTPPVQDSAPLSYNRDISLEKSLVHTPPTSEVAVAPVDEVASQKRKKAAPDFSPKVREVANQMINIIVKHNPVYRPPSDLTKFLYQVAQMIETDKQDPAILLKAFEWGVADNEQRGDFNGWQGIICTNNKGGKTTTPAEIFRKHFSKIHSQMNSRPKRKFAAGTDLDAAMEAMEDMNKRAL